MGINEIFLPNTLKITIRHVMWSYRIYVFFFFAGEVGRGVAFEANFPLKLTLFWKRETILRGSSFYFKMGFAEKLRFIRSTLLIRSQGGQLENWN